MGKRFIFDKNHRLTPLQICGSFALFANFTIPVWEALFSIQNIKKLYFVARVPKENTYEKKVDFLTKTME